MDRDTYDAMKDLREQVEELQERVEALESDAQPTETAVGGADQYDQYVLNQITDLGEEPDPQQILQLYKEAGVRDVQKIKDRHRFLKRSGKIEEALDAGENADA